MKLKPLLVTSLMCAALGVPSLYAQSALNRSVRTLENMEPAIPRPEQDRAVAKKLAALEKKTGKKPNIVWLLVDDMGYGDPGSYGGGEAIGAATPNMDRLAAEGLRLTSTYSQQTCTPTRSAMLTGRLPVRTGLTRPILAGDKITVNPWDGETSLPTILGEAGYNTLLVGKWHIGSAKGMRPHDVGFDEFYGFYGAQKEIPGFRPARYPDLVLDQEKLAGYDEMGRITAWCMASRMANSRRFPTIKSIEDMAEADKVLTDFSVQKIKELAKSDKPFFLEHAFMKVHTDNYAHPEFQGMSASKYPYKDAMCEVDMDIGMIVKALDEAGVLENTFIFVTSDNGPQMDGWPDAGYTPVPRGQGHDLGRRRARAGHRLLEGHDHTRPREGRPVRPDGPVQHLAAPRRRGRQHAEGPLHRRRRPDVVPAARRWPRQAGECLFWTGATYGRADARIQGAREGHHAAQHLHVDRHVDCDRTSPPHRGSSTSTSTRKKK